MSSISNKRLGLGGMLGALASAALVGVTACGDDGSDCQSSRTCASTSAGDAGADQTGDGGTSANPGDGGAPGSGGTATAGDDNAGGTAALIECTTPEDCDDGDVANGSEACGDDGLCAPGNPPPTVVSVTPDTDATGIEPDTAVVVTFSEALDTATVTSDNIQILDRGVPISGTLALEGDEVTFTPDTPLVLLGEYDIAIGTDVTDEDGAGLLEAYASTFRVRDGVWSTTSVVTDDLYQISDTLPITATGDALVSWIAIDTPGFYCPTSANWFNRGVAVSATPAVFTGENIQDCRSVTAGANAAGEGVVVWQELLEYAQQFRAGQWGDPKQPVSSYGVSQLFTAAVAPDGAVSYFQQIGTQTVVWRTNAAGTWESVADVISSERGISSARVAFDAEGNGFAAWLAQDSAPHHKILVSRYTVASGKWGTATALPGSIAAEANADYHRGVPSIAVDSEGRPVVLWIRETGLASSSLMASRFTSAGTWADPLVISGAEAVRNLTDAPALVFDGETFVAAWSSQQGKAPVIYSARFDMALDEFLAFEPQHNGSINLLRMPQLAADPHRNLLLVWAKTHAAGAELFYSRYDALTSTWSADVELPGGIVNDTTFDTSGHMPLSVNASGLGALMWADKNAQGALSVIRLASFH